MGNCCKKDGSGEENLTMDVIAELDRQKGPVALENQYNEMLNELLKELPIENDSMKVSFSYK